MKLISLYLLLILSFVSEQSFAGKLNCTKEGVWLQVLGSGGPEINDERASASYIVWVNGKARILVDAGGGSSYNFERSGADFNDIAAVLLSHLHVDHSSDLSTYIKGNYFIDRQRKLPIYGPGSNDVMPSTEEFVEALFSEPDGAYKYLSSNLVNDNPGRIEAHSLIIHSKDHKIQPAYNDTNIKTSAITVHHGPIPALAWKVVIDDKVLVFSGDMNGDYKTLPKLAKNADILVAHNAVPESAQGTEKKLHMRPSVIGEIAKEANVKQLILSHRMLRTLGKEDQTRKFIEVNYTGKIMFANDSDCFKP